MVSTAARNSGDVVTDSVTIINSGLLEGQIAADTATSLFSFANSGSITADGHFYAVALSTTGYADARGRDGESFTFANSGSIQGATDLTIESTAVTITNSGEMVDEPDDGNRYLAHRLAELTVYHETALDGMTTFNNSGTIRTSDYAAAGVSVDTYAGYLTDGTGTASSTVTVNNSGSILASGGNVVMLDVLLGPSHEWFGLSGETMQVNLSTGLSVDLHATGETRLTINNLAGGEIRADAAPLRVNNWLDYPQPQAAAGQGIVARADSIAIYNDGVISGATGGSLLSPVTGQPFPTIVSFRNFSYWQAEELEFVLGGAIDTMESTDVIVNSATGVINGSIALRQGDDRLTNLGTINGSVFMGSGDDRLETLLGNWDSHVTGIMDGGSGDDTLIFLGDQGGRLQDMTLAAPVSFEHVLLGGTGVVTSDGAMSTVGLAAGADITLAQGSIFAATGALRSRMARTAPSP
ncbi:MAG: hypothetical protein AB7E60_10895 [Sphingobium sp.]